MRVLVVLGDRALANTIDFTLQHGSFLRRSEGTLTGARAAIAEWQPHLLLLDIDLESGAAIRLIDEARAGGPIGVIALTRRSDLRGSSTPSSAAPMITSAFRSFQMIWSRGRGP